MQIETRRPCQQNQGNFSAANTALVYESIETDTLDTYELAALVMGAKPAVRRSPQYPAIVAETLRRVEAENDLLTVRMTKNLAKHLERWPNTAILEAAQQRLEQI
jgi:uncharacterized protein (DUF2252 family)